jgi:glutamyl-tRNA synthetase
VQNGAVAQHVGRFAPSPTGELHLGNLRTALVAWLSARRGGLGFVVRMEDLDRVTSSSDHERGQLAGLRSLGLDWDGEVLRQSERFARYEDAIGTLSAAGRAYDCFCTRREIREAAEAPNGPGLADGAYPGTCRALTVAKRAELVSAGRSPALRLRADDAAITVVDELCGPFTGQVDDFVLRRNDGVPAYNVAVVVDDALQDVAEVVRGDDLLSSTPRHALLQTLLGLPTPRYRHVPLVLGADGSRLAKRHGSVTLAQLAERGIAPAHVVSRLAVSLGLAEPGETVTAQELIGRFTIDALPRQPWVLPADLQRSDR